MSNASGRQPIQIVELQQPFCSRHFGLAPCRAVGNGDQHCYNTRASCKDTINFELGRPLSLFFANGSVADMGVPDVPYIIPSLMSVSTSPTRINLASSNPDAQGLGNRAVCNISIRDHAHSDRVVDPYLSGRSWNPLEKARGSFWSRWMARNKYRQNVVLKVYEGYAGQTLSEMTSRTYFLQSVQGPDSRGSITIQGKDVLARIEERKSQAPVASPGVLYAAINDSVTTFEVANAVEAEYAATGTLRIGDEVMTYTGRATSTNGVTFSGVTRGTDGTLADSHNVDASVQQCLRITDARIDDTIADLLNAYGGVDAEFLDLANWEAEISAYRSAYLLNGLITAPTAVFKLVSEIQTQTMVYAWWDERTSLVSLKSIRGIDVPPPTLTDEANIIAGSVRITEKPRERVSQVWFYYNQINPTKSVDDTSGYLAPFIIANLESETDELYGEPSIRKVFARFLSAQILAQTSAANLITRYVDIPSEIVFQMDAKDREYWIGDTVFISHYLDVDAFGNRRIRQWTIVSAEEKVPGDVVEYRAEDTTLYGRIHYIMPENAPNYPGAKSAPFRNCYIGDANGLLSDGSPCGRIS